jgi:uncharacterized membrane protein YvbJ
MKNIEQNILARNSNKSIAYICGKCGKEVEKEAVVCKFCGSKLGNIRCPFCNFIGDLEAFKDDTCPRCGRKKNNVNNKPEIMNSTSIKKNSFISNKNFIILLISLVAIIIIFIVLFLFYLDLI